MIVEGRTERNFALQKLTSTFCSRLDMKHVVVYKRRQTIIVNNLYTLIAHFW